MLLPLVLLPGLMLAANPLGDEPASGRLHYDNIQAFAIVAAMAQSASDRCVDIKINIPMIQAIKSHIGYDPDQDGVALRAAVQDHLKTIATQSAAAPSPQAWCDSIYGQFGPNGTVTPGLMLR